jgi:hypothetical protein
MKKALFFVVAAPALVVANFAATAQGVIYRCGNDYLSDAAVAATRGCQVVDGGHITVVPGTHVHRPEKEVKEVKKPPNQAAVGVGVGVAQRSRDMDALSILMAELKTAESRLAEQQQEYNSGVPEKLAIETQDPQRYQDRVNQLEDAIKRYTGDIAGLKREIARLPATLSGSRPSAKTPW